MELTNFDCLAVMKLRWRLSGELFHARLPDCSGKTDQPLLSGRLPAGAPSITMGTKSKHGNRVFKLLLGDERRLFR